MKIKNQSVTKVTRFLRKNKATICSVVAAVGVVAVGVLSANGALKAEEILREAKDEGKKEKLVKVLPHLIPPIAATGITVALIFMSDSTNKKTQAALLSAYTLSTQKLMRYRSTVKEVCGEDQAKQVDEKIFQDKISEWESAAEKHICANDPVGKDDCLFYDEYSGRYFWSTPEKVKDAEYWINRSFTGLYTVTLNDFYRLLGIDEIDGGDEIGWDSYLGEVYFGYQWIDFDHREHPAPDVDTPACCEIFMPFYPHILDERVLRKQFDEAAKTGILRLA